MRFSAIGVVVGSPGFELTVAPAGQALDDEIRISQSRCVDLNQCWGFLHLTLDTQPGERLAAGSKFMVDVSNNLVQNVVLEGMILELTGIVRPEDEQAVTVTLRHNSLISRGDPNYGISFRVPPGVPVVLANNVIAYIAHPLERADAPSVWHFANQTSSESSSTVWFENFGQQDFHPSANSPLLSSGDAAYGTAFDIDGRPREGHFDVGAYQR